MRQRRGQRWGARDRSQRGTGETAQRPALRTRSAPGGRGAGKLLPDLTSGCSAGSREGVCQAGRPHTQGAPSSCWHTRLTGAQHPRQHPTLTPRAATHPRKRPGCWPGPVMGTGLWLRAPLVWHPGTGRAPRGSASGGLLGACLRPRLDCATLCTGTGPQESWVSVPGPGQHTGGRGTPSANVFTAFHP